MKVASASYYIITLKINIRPGKKRETRGRIEINKRIMCLEEERMEEGEKSREMVERKEEGGKKD